MYSILLIICEHLHDLYTMNFLSGWKGLKKFIPRDSLNSPPIYILFSMLTTVVNYHKSGWPAYIAYFGFDCNNIKRLKINIPHRSLSAGYTFLLYGYWPGLTTEYATSETTARILFNFISCLSTRLEFLKRKILPTGPNGKR